MPKTVLLLMLAKAVATSSAVGSGIPGGVFTPMLLVLRAFAVIRRRRCACAPD
jgi:H+/Cl- antiporter ClcA